MAVLLVLASGTAVSLAVTDGESSAVGSNAAVQETTEVGNDETTEVDDETEDEAGDGEGDTATDSANVTIAEQESDGERIVIEEVTMEEGGFIAIHDETLRDGDAIGSVVGTSVYLEAGTHENVIVTLGRPITESQTLIAMPHLDTNDNQVYDFVISGGEADGPYTADGEAVVDEASVTVGEEQVETTTEEVDDVETTEVDDVETTEEDDIETTEVDDVETTTEEVDDVETTTEEVDDVETTEVDDVETTEVDDVETTEEDEIIETTTEEVDDVETTTEEVDGVDEPAEDEQQLIFKVEQMNIDRWSFVLGDEETPDRTETVSDITVQDRRVEINLTELLQEQSQMPDDRVTTQDPEEVQRQIEENLSGDIETVRFVIENVNVENVTFVITAPEDMELPEAPDDMGEMTTEADDFEETEDEEDDLEETTEDEVDDVETTTEADDVETTEEDEVIETTTEEVDGVETTTEEEEVDDVETTTEEEEVVETTTEEEEVVETTTTAEDEAELESFDVSALNAPESADVGDTVTVSAVVENPNDVEATQDVAFRLEGTVVAREDVTLNASGSTTVEFEVDTSDVPPGEYVHGVYTRDFGELAVITLNEPSDGEAETETEVGDEETELPDDEEETTVAVETTTEA